MLNLESPVTHTCVIWTYAWRKHTGGKNHKTPEIPERPSVSIRDWTNEQLFTGWPEQGTEKYRASKVHRGVGEHRDIFGGLSKGAGIGDTKRNAGQKTHTMLKKKLDIVLDCDICPFNWMHTSLSIFSECPPPPSPSVVGKWNLIMFPLVYPGSHFQLPFSPFSRFVCFSDLISRAEVRLWEPSLMVSVHVFMCLSMSLLLTPPSHPPVHTF